MLPYVARWLISKPNLSALQFFWKTTTRCFCNFSAFLQLPSQARCHMSHCDRYRSHSRKQSLSTSASTYAPMQSLPIQACTRNCRAQAQAIFELAQAIVTKFFLHSLLAAAHGGNIKRGSEPTRKWIWNYFQNVCRIIWWIYGSERAKYR